MIPDLEQVYERLRQFREEIAQCPARPTQSQLKALDHILGELRQGMNILDARKNRTNVRDCLTEIAQIKGLHADNVIGPELIIEMKKLNFTNDDLAAFLQCHVRNIEGRLKTGRKNMEERKTNQQFIFPPSLRDRDPETLTQEERYQIAQFALLAIVTSGKSGRDVMDAAGKMITHFDQTIKTESLRRWQQIKLFDDFYMTKFLPRLHKIFVTQEIPVDIKTIYREVLSGLQEETKKLTSQAYEESEMDKLIKKAKKRGKWVKKAEPIPSPELEPNHKEENL